MIRHNTLLTVVFPWQRLKKLTFSSAAAPDRSVGWRDAQQLQYWCRHDGGLKPL